MDVGASSEGSEKDGGLEYVRAREQINHQSQVLLEVATRLRAAEAAVAKDPRNQSARSRLRREKAAYEAAVEATAQAAVDLTESRGKTVG